MCPLRSLPFWANWLRRVAPFQPWPAVRPLLEAEFEPAGTLTSVSRGTVTVRDFTLKKDVTVKAQDRTVAPVVVMTGEVTAVGVIAAATMIVLPIATVVTMVTAAITGSAALWVPTPAVVIAVQTPHDAKVVMDSVPRIAVAGK